MFWIAADRVGRVAAPVLIHFLAANMVNMIGGLHLDAAFLTSITAVLTLPLFLWMYREDVRSGGLYEKNTRLHAGDAALIAALGVVCNLVLSNLVSLLFSATDVPDTVQEALFGSAFAAQLLGVGILVPFMEEVLFRGIVYRRLRGYTKTARTAALAAAAIFAVYHGNLRQMLFAFPMALIITAIYEKRKTLAAPVVFHIAVNVSSVLLTAYLR